MRVTYSRIEGYTKGTRQQFTDATGSTVSSFSFYCNTNTDKFIMAFYSDSSGNPSTEYWNSPLTGTACASAPSWQTIAIGSGTVDNLWNQQLTNNAYYWFMWQWNAVDNGPGYVTGGGANTGIYLAQTFGTLLGTWSGGTLSTENWSVYATYIPVVTMTVSYAVVGGGSGYTAPWFNYVYGGAAQHYQLTTTGAAKSVDSGSAWTVSQTSGSAASTLLLGSSGTEQWITSQSVSGTASAGTTIFTYYHQYL